MDFVDRRSLEVKPLFTQNALLRLIDNPTRIDEVERALPPLDDAESSEGWLRRGVAEGFFNANEILENGQPVATLVWSQGIDPQRVLNINAVLSLVSHDIWPTIAKAIRYIAGVQQCDIVEMSTRRPGMVVKCMKEGFNVHSVNLRMYL
jgi:hypothetical protein